MKIKRSICWSAIDKELVGNRLSGRVLLLCAIALLAMAGVAQASELRGVVSFHGLPVPGATVTVTEGEKKLVTVTDVQGFYSIADMADGAATVQIEMTGFEPLKQSVTVAPDAALGKWELTLLSLDAMRAALKPVASQPFTQIQTTSQPVKTAEAPKPEEKKDAKKDKTTDAASAAAPAEDNSQSANDGLLINGSVNNAATSQFSMAPRFGNTASGKSMYNYGFNLNLDNSTLDAKTYSFTGSDTPKPNTNQMTGGFSVQGPIKIPHLLVHGPTLFVGYQRTENSYATTQNGIMPDANELAGNLSELGRTIYAPTTGAAATCLSSQGITPGSVISNNQIPAACISTAAQALLSLYKTPNVTGNAQGNYQVPVVSDTHVDSLNTYVYKTVGPKNKDNINGNFAVSSTRSSNGSLFGFVDSSHGLGINAGVGWSHSFNWHLRTNVNYSFSHNSNRATPYWQNHTNPTLQQDITGNDPDPTYWGPPSLSFSGNSAIAGLSDGNSSFTRNETNSLSPRLNWNHGQHNVSFGFDFRRREYNTLSQANPRGSFTFTGTATAGGNVATPGSVTTAGSDFADFLLGIPDASSISYGNPDKYLRQSIYAGFASDDWRMNPQLTMKVGLRWDYGAPVTELQNRLLNQDIASNSTSTFAATMPVKANNPVGPETGQSYPTSLVRPDRAGFEPNIGVSWRPIPGSSLVIGAGYQMSYDTSVYQSIAQQMANQFELQSSTSKVLTLDGTKCPLTMANGFPVPGSGTTQCTSASTGTFGVDPNFRVGYVHTWNLQVRRDLPGSLQMTALYAGNKGTRGAQVFLPNTNAPGTTPCTGTDCPPTGFKYLTSNGNSHREWGTLQLRRRLHNGFTASATYTFSKSIDDDSSFGGGAAAGGAIAQNWTNLAGERGLSSFDQRHLLNTSFQYTTGMGMGGGSLLAGWRGRLYKEWTVQTQINLGSGTPETPIDGAVTVNGFSAVVRPDVTGIPLTPAPAGLHVNPAAFTAPQSGWGNARRDSITGPNQFSLSASMARTIRMKDKYTVDIQIAANNLLNHVTYSSWQSSITSSQFGLPVGANSMRDINASLRFRF